MPFYNRTKLDALLELQRIAAEAYRSDAKAWNQSTHPEADDESRRAAELAEEHDKFRKKLTTAAQSKPWLVVELIEKNRALVPDELVMTTDDVYGPDD